MYSFLSGKTLYVCIFDSLSLVQIRSSAAEKLYSKGMDDPSPSAI